MGRYIPPEQAGTTSANALAGKHALGARARKLKTQGILIVRFEMPFAVWCSTCPKPTLIGQGVRFNAEKKTVGHYLSTPVLSFRMKHAVCGGVVEVRTDPQNTRYVVHEGGQARDYGEDVVREGEEGREILSPEERERRREDAFAALEGKKMDVMEAKEQGKRIEELYEEGLRHWEDPYEASRLLRKGFRADRRLREKNARVDEKLKERMGFDMDLLPEHEDDRARAGMIEYGPLESVDEAAQKAASRPLFLLDNTRSEADRTAKKQDKKATVTTKKQKEADRRRIALQQEIRHNTRAAKDPFLSFGSPAAATTTTEPTSRAFSGIKRRRSPSVDEQSWALDLPPHKGKATHETAPPSATALVAYDSDDSD